MKLPLPEGPTGLCCRTFSYVLAEAYRIYQIWFRSKLYVVRVRADLQPLLRRSTVDLVQDSRIVRTFRSISHKLIHRTQNAFIPFRVMPRIPFSTQNIHFDFCFIASSRVQCSLLSNLTRFIDEFSVQLKICRAHRVCVCVCVVLVLTSTWWPHRVSNCLYISTVHSFGKLSALIFVSDTTFLLDWQTLRGQQFLVQTTGTVSHHGHSPLKVTNLIISRQYGSVCRRANAIELVYSVR